MAPEYDIQDYVLASPRQMRAFGSAPAPYKASVLLKVRSHALVCAMVLGSFLSY